jgi:hypothetical protein
MVSSLAILMRTRSEPSSLFVFLAPTQTSEPSLVYIVTLLLADSIRASANSLSRKLLLAMKVIVAASLFSLGVVSQATAFVPFKNAGRDRVPVVLGSTRPFASYGVNGEDVRQRTRTTYGNRNVRDPMTKMKEMCIDYRFYCLLDWDTVLLK